jgi:26S proteasome regulatory subunit N2
MAKMGSILASGILDAGGRNASVRVRAPGGTLRPLSVVGLFCFTQYWHWYPMAHFLSLAFTPTMYTGITATGDGLRVPRALKVICGG